MKRIEILFFEGCPNVDLAVCRARAAASAAGGAVIEVISIEGAEHARRLEFLGSPTVRVDGEDVEASARARDDFGLQCRVYAVDGQFQGAPPEDWIRKALA